jgi:heptosyltransferase-3
MRSKPPANFVMIRTDRMGDLTLSLPVAEAAKEAVPECRVCFVVAPANAAIARACPFVDGVIEYSETRGGLSGLFALARRLRAGRFDAAVFLRPTLRTALAAALARIPLRAGTAYRHYSWLFNRRVPEHRKHAEKHEYESNLAVLSRLVDLKRHDYMPRIVLDEASGRYADGALCGLGLGSGAFAIVHPGSGGSARNLSLENYARIADIIEREMGLTVLATCGPGEENLLDAMDSMRRTRSKRLQAPPGLLELAALIDRAALFVSGSTGPMHIAAALGTPTLSFFSPVRSCSPRRWGPLSERRRVIMPPVPECPTCIGEACEFYDCMDRIDMDEAAAAARDLVK